MPRTAVCSACQKPVMLGRGSLESPICRDCRSLGIGRNPKYTKRIGCKEPRWPNCWTCGASMDRAHGVRYCSRPCQPYELGKAERAKRDTVCTWCGKACRREVGRGHASTCSRFCQSAIRELRQGNTQSSWPKTRPCVECGTDYPTRSNSAGHRCPVCLQRFWQTQRSPAKTLVRFVSSQCPRCGGWWIGDRMAGSNTESYCSARCGRADARDRRRARQRAAFVEPVYRHKIFTRDQYRCHICKKKTDPTKSVPHPKAPTIDHVIPLAAGVAAGGTHEPANVATACFRCNSIKGDRGGGEQLALVG